MSRDEAIVGAARSQQALVVALDAAYERIERQKRVLADLRARLHEVPQPDLDGDEDSIPIKFVGTGKTLYADAYVDGLEEFVTFVEEWLDRLTEEAGR